MNDRPQRPPADNLVTPAERKQEGERSRRESCIRSSILVRLPPKVRGIVGDFGEILQAALIAGFDEGPSDREAFNLTLSRGILEDLRDLASDSEEIVATWDSSFGETSARLRDAVTAANAKLQEILADLDAAVQAERESS